MILPECARKSELTNMHILSNLQKFLKISIKMRIFQGNVFLFEKKHIVTGKEIVFCMGWTSSNCYRYVNIQQVETYSPWFEDLYVRKLWYVIFGTCSSHRTIYRNNIFSKKNFTIEWLHIHSKLSFDNLEMVNIDHKYQKPLHNCTCSQKH